MSTKPRAKRKPPKNVVDMVLAWRRLVAVTREPGAINESILCQTLAQALRDACDIVVELKELTISKELDE